MGMVLSLPLLGPLSGLASGLLGGLGFCLSSTAASAMCKSCNCNSSIATRVGFALIFLLNSIIAWLMLSDYFSSLVSKWTWDYIQCGGGQCTGVLSVHRISFALSLFHGILSLATVGVETTKNKRAAIQNGWWGPKVALWIVLILIAFTIPNGFFVFWGNWISVIGATLFILLGLMLLVDFAHTWSETCLRNYEESSSDLWKYILIGSTLGLYAGTITLTGVMYGFFSSSGCRLNQFLITFNLILVIIITGLSISPAIQDANPKSGLAQTSVVAAYSAYLILSAVANEPDSDQCPNPLDRRGGTRTTTVILGALFTFLAIAYSTTRAATQSRALTGGSASQNEHGYQALSMTDTEMASPAAVTTQPSAKTMRRQALEAAVQSGALPASALADDSGHDEDDDEAGAPGAGELDDEKQGIKYSYAFFHVIFLIASMYVAELLTNWQTAESRGPPSDSGQPVRIGRSIATMWVRIVSSWICIIFYIWTLVAPVVLPDRYGML